MDSSELTLLFHWLDYTALLLPKVCVVVVAAFVCIRLQRVRDALRGTETSWRHRLTMMLAFGGLAILATHSGVVVNVGQGVAVEKWPAVALKENQAVVGFRDTLVLAAGLIGGPWVGFGAGVVAGAERYWLGGFAGFASGFATLMLGIFAGWARRRRPHGATTPEGAFIVALFGTALHRLFILCIPKPYDWAVVLSMDIVFPVAVVNCLGCVLFIWVMRDLDHDRLKNELREAQWREQEADLRIREAEQRQQEAHLLKHEAELREHEAQSLKEKAELRALHAQIEPHFLNNTLSAIRALIRRDPDKAREFVVKLADFFETTRRSASANTIPLREELEQLKRYLDFQQLRFGEKFHYQPGDIAAALLDCHLPPRSLTTLAENALIHGMPGSRGEFVLRVAAEDRGDCLALRVADNGCGIPLERLAKLGKECVDSPHGNGSALHQLASSLALAFHGRAALAIASTPGGGTEVVLTLPKE